MRVPHRLFSAVWQHQENYTQAIRLKPDMAEAYYSRGIAYTEKGDKTKAEEDYVKAALIAGASETYTITRHLLPNFMSYLVVHITLAIPATILGETSLSFLGLGMQPPAVSWGVLLKDAQDLAAVAQRPWQLIPGIFVVVAVLMFSFIGDGLRDAADPHSR